MGEYAEMTLDGTLCPGCGEYMGDDIPGFPRYCQSCRSHSNGRKRHASVSKPVSGGSLSPKLIKRLQWLRDWSDNFAGMYPGDYYDAAPRQHQQLIKHGLAEIFDPHNPAHKTRVVITEAGRRFLDGLSKGGN